MSELTLFLGRFVDLLCFRPLTINFTSKVRLELFADDVVYYCLGSLFNDQWLLTTAHCLAPPSPIDGKIIKFNK